MPFERLNIFMRPICLTCNQNPVAVNYRTGDKIRYRKLCNACIKKGKKVKAVPAWFRAGYRKKSHCERCGFKAKYLDKQMSVYHLDGNLRNVATINLKTVCLNCRVEIRSEEHTSELQSH